MKRILIFLLPAMMFCGCRTITEDTKITVTDHVKHITTVTETQKTEESFTLGSQGLGTYYLIHLEGF